MSGEREVEMAVASFRKPYSCAQTVYAAFAPFDADKMELMRQNSGGKAPEGACGALFAAMYLNPDRAEEIKREFAKRAGDFRCAQIKGVHKTPCHECVRAAAELAAQK